MTLTFKTLDNHSFSIKETMSIERLLEANEDIKLNCPDCYDVWYGEDCPTTCTTCWCECGRGTLSLKTVLEQLKK